jgi:hypothetical protein
MNAPADRIDMLTQIARNAPSIAFKQPAVPTERMSAYVIRLTEAAGPTSTRPARE